LAQLRKADDITRTLREKKAKLKQAIGQVDGVKYRTLNDADGECGTLCTVLFDSAEQAAKVAQKLGTKTIDQSGWHVYANMEHINKHLSEVSQPHGKGAHPTTDDILSRAMNISIGVVDGGLGAGFGINIMSSDDEIESVAQQFREACR
jgi:8-amino-3,8-dideoxy-alpha-D-manno-octulosonate transaminase